MSRAATSCLVYAIYLIIQGLVLFAIPDVICATWTALALRADAHAKS